MIHRAFYANLTAEGADSETSLESKKPNDVGTHFVRLELLNLNM